MPIEDVLAQQTLENAKDMAFLKGQQQAMKDMMSGFNSLLQVAAPIIASIIQAETRPNVGEAIENLRREFQGHTDKTVAALEGRILDRLGDTLAAHNAISHGFKEEKTA